MAIGNSLGEGVAGYYNSVDTANDGPNGDYNFQILANMPKVKDTGFFYNASLGGTKSSYFTSRIDSLLIKHNPQYVPIILGSNEQRLASVFICHS